MNHYPGYNELYAYMQTENPNLKGFVTKFTPAIMTDWKVPGVNSPPPCLVRGLELTSDTRSRIDKRTWCKLYYQHNPEEKQTASTCTTTRSITEAASSMKLSTSNTGLKRKSPDMSLRMKDFTFEPVAAVNKWQMNDVDFSGLFAAYQSTSLKYCLEHDGSLKMSKDINELLSLSGILLLENDKLMSQSLLKHFNKSQLKDAYKHVKSIYKHVEVEPEIIMQTIKCLKSPNDEERDLLFLTLRRNTTCQSTKKAIAAIQSLMSFLPENSEKDCNEYTLASTIIHPLFMPLLKEQGVNPLPCNGLVHESSRVDSSRPDFRCDVYEDDKLSYSNLFGELKSASSNKEGQCLDLYRVMLFSKNVIDKKNKKSVMSFRAVGQKVMVYMLELMYDGFYLAVELFSFALPALKSEATMLVSVVEDLVNIHNLYTTNCFRELPENLKKSKVLPYDILLNSLAN
ncbi:hypothetical protein BD560DRAFT_383228 [Blakeslea trispora]|nr:hypothetical protein BD560DRAFT_383228 [Blakeslea trispora]